MYKLKNVSNNTLDILGKFIKPGEEIRSISLNPYKKLISSGFLNIIEDNDIQLVTLPKNKYTVKKSNHSINHQIINNINTKFPIQEKNKESDNINQIIFDKLDNIKMQISQDIDSKMDQYFNSERIYSSDLNEIISNSIKEQIINAQEQSKIENEKIEKSKIDNKDILTSLFHFYIDRELSEQDLINIKYFLINISEIKNIPDKLKNDINNTQSYEELITVLLNNVYPYLFMLD